MYYSSPAEGKPEYSPAIERWSLYKTIWTRHWFEFKRIYPHRFENLYGPLSDEKSDEVIKLIQCGKFKNGFQRHTCPDWGTVLVVPFTCKSRLCLSCARKRLFGWSLNLSYIMNTNLKHNHVTFTIPGTISRILFERKYEPEQMITLASNVFRNMLISSAKLKGKPAFSRHPVAMLAGSHPASSEFQPGILSTLHKSGNGLNYIPHVHLIGTRELVDTTTGEIIEEAYMPYQKIRHVWKSAFLKHLKGQGIITLEEYNILNEKFANGFHVFFQPIDGNANEILFRTAEYIATGFFHNSQITEVDFAKKTVTFKYKSWVDRSTWQKNFKTRKMNIHSFMARMLFFLPDKNRKMIRYYGIYAHKLDEKLKKIETRTWAMGRSRTSVSFTAFDHPGQHN